MSSVPNPKIKSRIILVKEGTLREALIKLVFAFLLTTVCGTVITGYMSSQDKKRELEHDGKEQQKIREQRHFELKNAVFREISSDIDSRYYSAFRCISSYKSNDPLKKQQELYQDYQKAVSQWNTHRMRNRGLLKVYFPEEIGMKYDEIHKAFGDQLHDTIRSMQKNKYLDPSFDLATASPEEKEQHQKAHSILKKYYPKALSRLNQSCTEFVELISVNIKDRK